MTYAYTFIGKRFIKDEFGLAPYKKKIFLYLHGLTTHTEGNSKVLMKEFEGSPSHDKKTIAMAVTEVFRDVKANPQT